MQETILYAVLGATGGLIRAIIGAQKALKQKKKFKLNYFLMTVIIAGIIGAILGMTIETNKLIALTAGYAGTDLLEGLAKSFKTKK